MKISKKIATLLSCVMVGGCLASCGKKENDSSSPEKPAEPEKTITIAELPQVCVTETLDLSSYITCTGGTGSYTITVGESAQDFAGLDISGKKIFAEHSGEVPFTVTYSGKTAQGSVSFVSEEYVKFLEQSKDRGYDYAVYGLDDNFYGIESCYNFAENFMIDLYNLEGYFESEGKVYSVALEIDDQDEISASYSLTGYEPDDISEISVPWNIDPSVVKSVYVPEEVYQGKTYEAYESIVIDDVDTLKTLCGPLFGYSYDLFVRNDVTPTKIELMTEYLSDGKGGQVECFDAYLYVYGEMMDGSFDEGLFDIVIIELQDGAFVAGDLVEFFKTEKPHGKDYGEFVAVIDSVLEGKNFSVVYEAGWEDENGQSCPNPFVYAGREGLGLMIHDYLMADADSTLTAYVTNSQTYIENGKAEYSYGLVSHDGKVYGYEGENHEAFELLSDSDDIFDERLVGEAANYVFLHSDEGSSLIEQLFVNEVTMEGGSGSISFAGASAIELFDSLFDTAIPVGEGIDEEIKDDMEYLAQFKDLGETAFFFYDQGMVKYLVGTIEIVSATSIKISFTWEDEDDEGNAYYYVLSATITNLGTTEIPGDVVVNFGE